MPGNADAVFTFGHSGGGAQSALMGATGDTDSFMPYLEAIGAVMEDANGNPISDAISGAMCWCPITCLDEADAAYEWMMGQFGSFSTREDGTWTAALSGDLARSYAEYVNKAGFVDENGSALTLGESQDGVCMAGSYHDYVLDLVNRSLNNFLADTTFPYSPSSQVMGDGGFGQGLGGPGAPTRQGGPEDGQAPSGAMAADGSAPSDGDVSPDSAASSSSAATNDGTAMLWWAKVWFLMAAPRLKVRLLLTGAQCLGTVPSREGPPLRATRWNPRPMRRLPTILPLSTPMRNGSATMRCPTPPLSAIWARLCAIASPPHKGSGRV